MSKNIYQHYVPQSLLKNFTYNKNQVYCLLQRDDMPIIPTHVKNICQENGFYQVDIETEDEPKKNQKIDYDQEVFQKNDCDIAPVIRKIIENGSIKSLETEEIKTLVRYTAYQYCRVPSIRNLANSILNDEQEARLAHAGVLTDNDFVSSVVDMLISLKVDTIKPMAGDEFVISDSPVLLDPTGEGIYFPISPDICLVYYHPSYNIANCLDSICINDIQFLAATQFVIARNQLILDKIKISYHKNYIAQILKKSENNSYWRCILEKKVSGICLLEQNRNNILEPLRKEYDQILSDYLMSLNLSQDTDV